MSKAKDATGKDPDTGRFVSGNRFWEKRTKHGPNFKYPKGEKGAALLWDDCIAYFEWNEANPIMQSEPVKYEGKGSLMEIPLKRAMTIEGLTQYLGIVTETWREWKDSRSDLSAVITRVEQIIFRQKLEGAAAGQFNSNIMARHLGLADKKQHEGLTVNISGRAADL